MAHRVLPLSQPASATYSSRPLPYATKTELVYQHLRHLMVNGALLPGQRIYLDEIAIQLGVSTNPVREALRRLESEGLITNRPHTGACVSVLDIKQIEVHFMIRGVLEGLAMRLAAVRLTASELERLDALHRDLGVTHVGQLTERSFGDGLAGPLVTGPTGRPGPGQWQTGRDRITRAIRGVRHVTPQPAPDVPPPGLVLRPGYSSARNPAAERG